MKELMKTNIYDVNKTIIVVGSCLKSRDPQVFEQLQKITSDIYDVCLEETHINMAITKIAGMLRTHIIEKVIFVSVDKSPHCVQLHYIQEELCKMMGLNNIMIENYVADGAKLIKISPEAISLSKNLIELNNITKEN